MKLTLSWSRFSGLFCLSVLFSIAAPALSAAPEAPGTPTGSAVADTVNIEWTQTNATQVAGYNVYQNDTYRATVASNSYSGLIDSTIEQRFYIVSFDAPAPGEVRQFSGRSGTLILHPNNNSGNKIPSAPQNVQALRVSDTRVALTWDPSTDDEGIAGYNVYRNGSYLTTVSESALLDTDIVANSAYTYYLVAFDEPRNFAPRSAEVTADTMPVTDSEAPERVSGLMASSMDERVVTLTWENGVDNIGVDGYNIYRDGAYLETVFTNSFEDLTPPAAGVVVDYAITAFDLQRNFSVLSDLLTLVIEEYDPGPQIPVLKNPNANAIKSPDFADPFGKLLEQDDELPTVGGPPTQPKNLRAELVANDWAELNWAPSNDDGEVVEYRVYRSDGHIYTIRGDQFEDNAGTQLEIDKFWNTTSFIDCNYTRFSDRLHVCDVNGPAPGDEFIYEVSAVDNDGMESARSEPLEITFQLERNAPIPWYDDIYKETTDKFVQQHDLSRTKYFLDEFVPVFADEFDGTEIDSDYWFTGLTWGDSRIINGEQQYFVNTQQQPNFGYNPFTLTGESLIIEAIPTPAELVENLPPVCDEEDPTGNERCAFLSGALSSHDKFGITYGYVESRMKTSGISGALSSFYLYHRYAGEGAYRHAPEIDIVEYLGENPFGDEDAFQTYHYSLSEDEIASAPTMFNVNPNAELYANDFHTYGVLWEPQLVIWYIDGIEIKRMFGPQVSRQQMNIVAYLVAGSAWAPRPAENGVFPLQFEIDYIKAWQRPPFDVNGLYPTPKPEERNDRQALHRTTTSDN